MDGWLPIGPTAPVLLESSELLGFRNSLPPGGTSGFAPYYLHYKYLGGHFEPWLLTLDSAAYYWTVINHPPASPTRRPRPLSPKHLLHESFVARHLDPWLLTWLDQPTWWIEVGGSTGTTLPPEGQAASHLGLYIILVRRSGRGERILSSPFWSST